MNRSTNIRRGVATGIAGAGLAVGAIGIASAAADGAQSDSSMPAASSSTDTSPSERDGRERGHGAGHGGRGLGGSELAEALGVSETDLRSALASLRGQLEPSQTDRSTPPTEDQREERRAQLVDALAEELDLSPAEVTAAFDEVQQDRAAERRTALSDRLDEAVTAGDLTTDDRASVLKAFDAGVLGGGSHGGRGAP